jgi:hypothetical protein
MKLAVCVGMLLVAGQCLATKTETATPDDAADALLAVALNRALVTPKDLPDINLVESGPEIVVRSTIPNSKFSVRPRALPKVHGKNVVLLSKAEIEARAAERGDVYFVMIDNLKIENDAATFTIGTGMATSPSRPVLCCCVAIVEFARAGGVWTYKGSKGQICS